MSAAFESLKTPSPTRTRLTTPFWDAAARGRLLVQRCERCERAVLYPRAICPHCWHARLRWEEASGRGRLKSFTIVHRPGHPAWAPVTPFALGLVELDEGVTMLSHIIAEGAALAIGMRLILRPTQVGAERLPFFAPESIDPRST